MPPQTTKELIREKALSSIQKGVGALQMQTQPSPDQTTSANPNFSEIMHIPGASMHEVIRMGNDHNKDSGGDRICIPGNSRDFPGTTGPEYDRTDNYGNKWLKSGFEYPPYDGQAETMVTGEGSEQGRNLALMAGPGPEVAGKYPIEGEQSGAAMVYDGADAGAKTTSGHTGSRSDKWPAPGLVGFKNTTSNPPGHTNSTPGS